MGKSRSGPVEWMVTRAAEITGNSAAAGAGLVLGSAMGPSGALVGAVVGPVVAQLSEFGMRTLGRREEERVAAAVVFACQAFEHLQAQGAEIRSDGFFESGEGGRPDGDEVIEGVLRAAQLSHEERKLPYLGYLLALIAVDEACDRGLGNWLIRSAEQLSWTQFVLLSLIPNPDSDAQTLPTGEAMAASTWNAWSTHRQLVELGYGKLELVSWAKGATPNLKFSYPVAEMSGMRLRHGGLLLHHFLALDSVPQEDRDLVREALEIEADDSRVEGG